MAAYRSEPALSPRRSPAGTRWALLACVWLLAALVGCGEAAPGEADPPEDAPGSFEAEVRGALHSTLRGQATVRFDSAGRLAGLELDDANDTTRAGLSFELAAKPQVPQRSYTVTPQQGGREDTSFSLMNAYLRVRGYAFAARVGSLRVRRDSTGLHGTFDLRLRGIVEAASDEAATVMARGRFDEVRPGAEQRLE